MNDEKKEFYQNKYNIVYEKDANCVVMNDVQFHQNVTLCAGNAKSILDDIEKATAEKMVDGSTAKAEETTVKVDGITAKTDETAVEAKGTTGKTEDTAVEAKGTTAEDEESTVKAEDLCHFIHPCVDDKEAQKIHRQVLILATRFPIRDICTYLQELADQKKLLLFQNPKNAYNELRRMGMPNSDGFGFSNFLKYYRK